MAREGSGGQRLDPSSLSWSPWSVSKQQVMSDDAFHHRDLEDLLNISPVERRQAVTAEVVITLERGGIRIAHSALERRPDLIVDRFSILVETELRERGPRIAVPMPHDRPVPETASEEVSDQRDFRGTGALIGDGTALDLLVPVTVVVEGHADEGMGAVDPFYLVGRVVSGITVGFILDTRDAGHRATSRVFVKLDHEPL